MSNSKFYDLVNTKDVRVSIPEINHFTIGSSPYYAHQHGLAIDIYKNLSLENYEALSPISGTIIKTKILAAPKSKSKNLVDKEYLTLIRNSHNSNITYKILHIKPYYQVGEKIKIGDCIGSTIRNGYFAPWSSPHLHLEIRSSNDAVRASGGKQFSLNTDSKNRESNYTKNSKNKRFNQIPVEIHYAYPEFSLACLPENFYFELKPIYGIKVKINNLNCILDGGIPHYKNGVVLFQKGCNLNSLDPIYLGIDKIAALRETRGQFGFIKFDSVKFLLNNKEIRGISLYLANFLPLIKIIPYNFDDFSYSPKSTQKLSIISQEKS